MISTYEEYMKQPFLDQIRLEKRYSMMVLRGRRLGNGFGVYVLSYMFMQISHIKNNRCLSQFDDFEKSTPNPRDNLSKSIQIHAKAIKRHSRIIYALLFQSLVVGLRAV